MQAFVSCTNCRQQVPVEETAIGQSIECSSCGATFIALDLEFKESAAPAAAAVSQPEQAAAPAPAAHPPRAITIRCTNCQKKLRVDETWLGKTVKCPMCQSAFLATPAGPRKPARETLLANPRVRQPESGPRADLHGPGQRSEDRPQDPYAAGMADSLANGGWSASRGAAPNKPGGAPPAGRAPASPPKGALTTFRMDQQEDTTGRGLPPLKFTAIVLVDPDQILQGRFDAEVTQEGLTLRQGSNPPVFVPTGSPAEHLGNNCITVIFGLRRVEMAIVKRRTDQQRLAADIAAFLNGDKKWLYAHSYTLPLYLYAPALLPLGIPVLAIPNGVLVGGAMGGALWGGLGVGLAASCVGIAQKDKWPIDTRVIRAACVAALGYLILLAAFVVGSLSAPPKSELGALKPYTSEEGLFTASLPGSVQESDPKTMDLAPGQTVTIREYAVALKNPEMRFAVHYFDPPRPRTFDDLSTVILNDFPGSKEPSIRKITLAGHEGREYTVGLLREGFKAIRQVTVVKKRVYYLTVEGSQQQLGDHAEKVQEFFKSFKIEEPQLKPDDDLRYATREPIEPFLTAVVNPEARYVLATTKGTAKDAPELSLFSYPDFRWQVSIPLDGVAYQAALDTRHGRLYLAVCDPQALADEPPSGRHKGTGLGSLRVYEVANVLQALKDKDRKVKLAPVTVIPEARIANLVISRDDTALYYLDVKDPNNIRVGRINLATEKEDKDLVLAKGTEALCLSPDGKTLYTVAAGEPEGTIQLIDTKTMTLRDSFPVKANPYDVDANNEGLLFLTCGRGGSSDLLVIDSKSKKLVTRVDNVERYSFVKLSGDQRRVYLASHPDSKAARGIRVWSIPEPWEAGDELLLVRELGATKEYPLSGPLLLTPDGKYFLSREGTVLKINSAGRP